MPLFHDLVSLVVREDGLREVLTGALEYLLLAGLLVVLTPCVFSCRFPSDLVSLVVREDGFGEVWTADWALENLLLAGLLL